MTGLTAETLKLPEVGFIRTGYKADITIFDPAKIKETNSFSDPRKHPVGIDWVLVGGVVAMAEGKLTGNLNGQVLRRQSH